MPDPVQPAATPDAPEGAEVEPEGQGEAAGLYDLSSVPDELKPHVEEHLKQMEANATRKFQEFAEQRKAWEPYEELGINELDPAALKQLLQFAELAQDEDRFKEWWEEVGERMELFEDGSGGELDFSNENFSEDELTPESIKAMIAEGVSEAVKPIQESLTQGEQERLEQEAMSEVTGVLDGLKEEHGADLDTDAILQLAYAYVDEDPDNAVQKGFEDFQRIVGAGQASLLKKKADDPARVEGPGSADTTPRKITSFEDAKAAAAERFKATV
jgi:hypothetical protein